MTMTKKDYELIASAIDELFMGHHDWQRSMYQVATKLSDVLAKENPKFDVEKFLQACGL